MLEIERTADPERKRRLRLLASHAHQVVNMGQRELMRAREIQGWGISSFDAFHAACAEAAGADVFLTTDDRLLDSLTQHADKLKVRPENPLVWLQEVG